MDSLSPHRLADWQRAANRAGLWTLLTIVLFGVTVSTFSPWLFGAFIGVLIRACQHVDTAELLWSALRVRQSRLERDLTQPPTCLELELQAFFGGPLVRVVKTSVYTPISHTWARRHT